jgi:hypothetical protein
VKRSRAGEDSSSRKWEPVHLRNIASGHSGSIAGNLRHCELAFEQLMLRVRQSRGGQGVSREDIRALVRRVVDAVVQFGVEGGERFIGEVSLRNPADGLSE